MEWNISNKRRTATLAVITALIAFSTVFLLTGYIMTTVYGLKPGDTDFYIYEGDGQVMTPYNNFLFNGCLEKKFYLGDQTVIMDTKGLEELGMFYYDVNTCFDMAKEMTGYTITSVESYTAPDSSGYFEDEHMRITLTKQGTSSETEEVLKQQENTNNGSAISTLLNGLF